MKSACPAIAAKEKHEKKLAYEERRSQQAKENKTKDIKTKENKTKENKTKENKTKTAFQNRFVEYESSDSEEEKNPVVDGFIGRSGSGPIGRSGPIGPNPVDVKPIDPSIPTFAEMLAREPPKPSLKEEVFQSMFTFTPLRRTSSTAAGSKTQNWIETDDEEEDENW